MTQAQLVVDTNVVSYMFRGGPLGRAYADLIGERILGVTLLSVAESRAGVESRNWGSQRTAELDHFLGRFVLLRSTLEIANVCGGLLGRCRQIGLAMAWPDAWSAATALWLGVPLVTHDRDLEGVPDLRVITVHDEWRLGEECVGTPLSSGLWSGEAPRASYSALN